MTHAAREPQFGHRLCLLYTPTIATFRARSAPAACDRLGILSFTPSIPSSPEILAFFLRRMRFRYCFRAQTALRRRRRRLRTENQYSSDVINRRTFSRRRLVYSKEESTGALRGSRQTNGSLLKCKRRTHKLFIRKCRVCQVSVRNTEAKSLFSAVFLRRRFSQNGRVRRTGRCSQMEFNNRTIV